MKKIVILAIMIMAMAATSAMAAWPVTAKKIEGSRHGKLIIQVDVTDNDGLATSFDLMSKLTAAERSEIKGRSLSSITVNPDDGGDAPSAVFDVTFANIMNVTYTLANCSVTATANYNGWDVTNAGLLYVYDILTVTIETLGSGNKATLLLEF